MSKNYTVRCENAADHCAIRRVHDAAFGSEEGIPEMVDDLRNQDTLFATESLVAEHSDGELVGHVMLSHAWVDGDKALIDVMVLSPLGVVPTSQKQGIGTALVVAALEAADKAGAPLLFLEGSPTFYGSRGFEKAIPLGFHRPSRRIPENAFQVAKLSKYDASISGAFVYHDVHWRHGVGLYR